MAISIDWPSQVITVPKADTTLVSLGPPEIRSLDVDQFRKDLNALQAGAEGIPELTTHVHTAPVTLGGVEYARQVEIVNGYTVTFEDGAYAVNLAGVNNNISDVANLNTVSIRSANSAGLQIVSTGSGLSAAQDTKLTEIHDEVNSIEGGFGLAQWIRLISASVVNRLTGHGTGTMHGRDMADTKDRITTTYTDDGRDKPTLDPN